MKRFLPIIAFSYSLLSFVFAIPALAGNSSFAHTTFSDFSLSVTVDVGNASCNGAPDGVLAAQADGGLPPYSYLWSNGQTTQIITGLTVGTYSVTVTDDAGATASATATVDQSSPIVVNTASTYETCFGSADGKVDVITADLNGTAPYTYLWSTGSTNYQITNLSAGTYYVTVTDANGCTGTGSGTVVLSPEGIWLMATATPITCFGANDGTAHVSAMTGVPPYTYIWDDPAATTTADPVNLSAGVYHVTVTDANGCSNIAEVEVTEPAAITVQAAVTNEDCNAANGSISLTVSGGVAPYHYQWSNAAIGDVALAANLSSGVYSATITDASGCTQVTGPIEVKDNCVPDPCLTTFFNIQVNVTNEDCTGGNGSISLSVSGGLAPYSYQWSDATIGNVAQADNLSAGLYSATITDANGCTKAIGPIEVAYNCQPCQNTVIEIQVSVINENCGGGDGSISLTVSGGTTPYSYQWSDAAIGDVAQATNLSAGSYSATVTDANGCTQSVGPVAVANDCTPPPCTGPVITSVIVYEATCGKSNGSATVNVFGGPAGFDFAWSPNVSTSNSASNIPAGTYSVTITDLSDATCTIVETFTVGVIDGPPVTIVSTTPATCQENNGTAVLAPIGLTYEWCNGFVGNNPTNLPAGECQVTITDPATNCVDVIEVVIDAFVPLMANPMINQEPDCGVANGSVTIQVAGGSFNYTYAWSDGGSGETRTDLISGAYTVTVTDNGPTGCVTTTSFVLNTSTGGIDVMAAALQLDCPGVTDGTVIYTVIPNDPTYTVVITDAAGTEYVNGTLGAGNYCLRVFDPTGCETGGDCFTVTDPDQIDVDVDIINKDCTSNGAITLVDVSGGNGGFTFDWADLAGNNDPQNRIDLPAGTYSVTITDAKGCSVAVDGLTVIDNCICTPPVITSVVVFEATCLNSDGSAIVNVFGGPAGFDFAWSPNVSTSNSASNIPAGTYSVTITDLSDATCTIVETFTVGVIDGPPVTIVSTTPATCQENNGTAVLAPIGLTYEWCNGFVGNNPTNLPAGECQVTITDPATGCVDVIEVVIDAFVPLVANPMINQEPDCGVANGSVTIQVTGGSFNYTYAWSDGGSGETRTDLISGAYTVTVTDNGPTGCVTTTSFVLNTSTGGIDVMAAALQLDCPGATDGTVIYTVIPNDPTYTVVITDAAGTEYVNGTLGAGNYCLRVFDPTGCETGGDCFTVTDPDQIDVDVDIINKDCISNGAITLVDVSGGNGGFTYDWADLNSANEPRDRTNLTPGTYSVTITDAKGCSVAVDGLNVGDDCLCAPPVVTSVVVVESHCNLSDGKATVHIDKDIANYNFNWTPSVSNDNKALNIPPGIYSVRIVDKTDNTCVTVETFTVGAIEGFDFTYDAVNASCNAADGSLTFSPDTLQYQWDDGFIGETRNDLIGGTYFVEITDPNDPNSCHDFITLEVGEENPIQIEVVVVEKPDCNEANGTVSLIVTGGSNDYTFSWGGTNATQTGLSGGVYTIVVTDNITGCKAPITFGLTEKVIDARLIVDAVVQTSCTGNNDGTVDVTSVDTDPGFVGPAVVTIEDAAGNIYPPDSLPPGNYCAVIRDANNCIAGADCFEVVYPRQIDMDIAFLHRDCINEGSITIVEVLGGTGVYNFDWTDLPASTDPRNRLDLVGGDYTIILNDANGCAVAETITVEDNAAQITAQVNPTNIACAGTDNGAVTIVPAGGASPYTFEWNANLPGTATQTDLAEGDYIATVTDANGCFTVIDTVKIITENSLEISVTEDTLACVGNMIDLSVVINSVLPADVEWTNSLGTLNETTPTISVSVAGTVTYYVSVTSGECEATDSVVVTEFVIQPPFNPSTIVCNGSSAVLNEGGDDYYTYQWEPADQLVDPTVASPEILAGMQSGVFSVTITDPLNPACPFMTTANLTVNELPSVDITGDSVACNYDPVELTAVSNNTGTSFIWSDNPDFLNPTSGTTFEATPGQPGDDVVYYVQVTDANGCENQSSVALNNFAVRVTLGEPQKVCLGEELVLVPLISLSDGELLDFSWSGENVTITGLPEEPVISPTETTMIVAQIENNYGCTMSDSLLIEVESVDANVQATADPDTILLGESSQLNVLADENYDYVWSPGATLDADDIQSPEATPMETTTYTVNVATKELGCAVNRTVTVVVVQECKSYLFFPNAFTPNGDGYNDVLYLRGPFTEEVFFVIYNRWGEKVYESHSINDGWDGTYKGEQLPPDVFGYYLRVKCINGEDYYEQGNVSLLR